MWLVFKDGLTIQGIHPLPALGLKHLTSLFERPVRRAKLQLAWLVMFYNLF